MQSRVKTGEIYRIEATQTTAAVANLRAIGIAETRAQRLNHPRAAVIGGAAANANDDIFRPMIQRLQNQLAGTARRRQ